VHWGLFYLSNTPDLSQDGDQSSGTAQTPGGTGLLQAQAPQGVTESVVNSTNQVVKNASTDASTLGLSNQIVGLLGTIAGASVAGIAGLLVGPGKTEQPPAETSTAVSPTDRLRQWAKLRDEGIITPSDFDTMKSRLLAEEQAAAQQGAAQQSAAQQGAGEAPQPDERELDAGQERSQGQQRDS
jgi:hypothetical protein